MTQLTFYKNVKKAPDGERTTRIHHNLGDWKIEIVEAGSLDFIKVTCLNNIGSLIWYYSVKQKRYSREFPKHVLNRLKTIKL